MSRVLTFDVEATGATKNKAKPHDPENRCAINCWRVYDTQTKEEVKRNDEIEYVVGHQYLDAIQSFQDAVNNCDLLVGMNIKYDMNWMRRYGINFRQAKLWDIQVFHSSTNYQCAYPSLDEIAEYWNLPSKLDIVKKTYWEQGVDTDLVPYDLLVEYGEHDVWLTQEIARRQFDQFKKLSKNLQATIKIQMQDIAMLFEMEWNGFKYDTGLSAIRSQELIQQALSIVTELDSLSNVPVGVVNWGSNDQKSCVLYGGMINYKVRESFLFTYKDPKKQPVMKERWVAKTLECSRLVEPLRRSELAKEGYWSTDEGTLRKLKPSRKNVKRIIELLLELAKVNKMNSTYFSGLPKKMEEYGWLHDCLLHPGLNQCGTVSGRLASSNPNGQNVPKDNKECWVPRDPINNVIVNVDAANLEWRTMINITNDKTAYQEVDGGLDFHTDNQQRFDLPSRLIAKVFLFRWIYLGQAFAYANDPDFSFGNAKFWDGIIQQFNEKYSAISGWHRDCVNHVMRHKIYESPISGRQYKFEPREKRGELVFNDSEIVNLPNQGLGADIMALIRVMMYEQLKEMDLLDRIKPLLTVHDSVTFECPKELLGILRDVMHSAFSGVRERWNSLYDSELFVPIGYEATVGKNYKDEQSWLVGDGKGKITEHAIDMWVRIWYNIPIDQQLVDGSRIVRKDLSNGGCEWFGN
jgi:DNA polymerase I-like protein with 3'-5' exonuclease and polymerase domains